MGLFGGTKIYVASSVYNLAGDETKRPNYFKTVVLSNVITGSKFSMGDTINTNYMGGPGIKIRNFHRWTKLAGNYDQVGVPHSYVRDETDLNAFIIRDYCPVTSPNIASVSAIRYGVASYSYWAEQYMMAYHIEVFGEAWTSDYNAATNQITITRADGVTTHTFTPVDFVPDAMYFYTTYSERNSSTGAWIRTAMYIYRVGSGVPAIDSLITTADTSDEFISYIPIRIENQFISDTYYPEVWGQTKKAYKKLTGGSLSDLVEKIADNEDLGDIDHCYLVNGVPLNTKDRACRRYLYRFFENMHEISFDSVTAYNAYQSAWAAYQADYQAWKESRTTWSDEHPGVPFPPPPAQPAVLAPTTSIEFKSAGLFATKLRLIAKWKATQKITGSGLGKPDAKVGDVWWSAAGINPTHEVAVESSTNIWTDTVLADTVVRIWWQKTPDYWESIRIIGMTHENKVYQDKSVLITAKEALEDTDESGFIIPIHYNTLKEMSLIDSTQVMTQSSLLVFNCYKVVKKKWYQTGIFQIFVFVAIVVVVALTGGAGAVGILGTAGSVGGAFGFTGVMATIVGAAVNALAGMIVGKIIMMASVQVFGEKFGALIGAVVGFVAFSVGSGLMNGQSLSAIWQNMGSATSLLQLTNAVGTGISGYVSGAIKELSQEMSNFQTEMDKKKEEYENAYAENIGYDRALFDPMRLTETFGNVGESPSQFLNRTLLTGSEVADISLNMITSFTDLTTSSPLPGSS